MSDFDVSDFMQPDVQYFDINDAAIEAKKKGI